MTMKQNENIKTFALENSKVNKNNSNFRRGWKEGSMVLGRQKPIK